MGVRGGGGAAGIAATCGSLSRRRSQTHWYIPTRTATVGMATGTDTSNVSPALRFSGITTFILRGAPPGLDARLPFRVRRGGAHNWPLMLYWTVSPGDLYRRTACHTRVRVSA